MQLVCLGSRAQFGKPFSRLIEVCPNYENKPRVSPGDVKRGHRHLQIVYRYFGAVRQIREQRPTNGPSLTY